MRQRAITQGFWLLCVVVTPIGLILAGRMDYAFALTFALLGVEFAFLAVPADRIFAYMTIAVIGMLALVSVGQSQLALVLVALGVVVLRRGNTTRLQLPPGLLMFGGYFAMTLVLMARDDGGVAWRQWLLHAVIVAGLYPLASFCSLSERRIVLRALISLGVAEAVYGVFEVATGRGPLWGSPIAYENQIFSGLARAQGTLGHSLALAFLLVVALGLTLAPGLVSSLWHKFALSGVFLVGMLAAGSRSALIVSVVMVLFVAGRGRGRLIVGGYVAILGVVALWGSGFFSSDLVTNFVTGSSVSHRGDALPAAHGLLTTQNLAHTLFGNGYWSVPRLFAEGRLQTDGFNAVDNGFVYLLAEGGVVGLLLFLGPVLWAIKVGAPELRLALVGALAMFLSFDVSAWPSALALVVVLTACSLAFRAGRAEEVSEQPQEHPLPLALPADRWRGRPVS